MQLSERLKMNVSLVPKGARIADIGCDHGYASIWLVQEGIAERVIASDVNRGPIERAVEHVRLAGLERQIECRQGNGTERLLPGEVDTLMIAGMGGPLMIHILSEGRVVLQQVRTLILQPQSDIGAVRHYLYEHGFTIRQEKICLEDGKYYFAIRAERREAEDEEKPEAEWQFRYGTYLAKKRDPVFKNYLNKERNTFERILENPQFASANREDREEIVRKIREIEACLASMEILLVPAEPACLKG